MFNKKIRIKSDLEWANRCTIKECIPGWHIPKTIDELEHQLTKNKCISKGSPS